MKIIKTIEELKNLRNIFKKDGKTIGFVPTMGFLHEGHMSLVEKSKAENDITVVSIFVNPTQFGANEDLDKYPRDIDSDTKMLEEKEVDILFFPESIEMYPEGYLTYCEVEAITAPLCGKTRPTHFKGVTTVVLKLFNIVAPDIAYFGQKDAQQLIIIKKMVSDLNLDVKIIGCPIIREVDGLAKSSRNTYLSESHRKQATVLYKSLALAEKLIQEGERNSIKIIEKIKELIDTAPDARIDYVEIVDTNTLHNKETISEEILIALAVKFGNTRLIDNTILESE